MMIGQTNATCDNGMEIVRLQSNMCVLTLQVTAINNTQKLLHYYRSATQCNAMYGIKIGNTYWIMQYPNDAFNPSSITTQYEVTAASKIVIKSVDIASLFSVGDRIRVFSNAGEGLMCGVNSSTGTPPLTAIIEGTIQSITGDVLNLTNYTMTGVYGQIRSSVNLPNYVIVGFEKL